MNIQELISKLPDTKSLDKLSILLKKMSEEEASNIILIVLTQKNGVTQQYALELLRRRIDSYSILIFYLELKLEDKNDRSPSSIQNWLKVIGTKIGYRKLLYYLKGVAETRPEIMVRIWYYLNICIKTNSLNNFFILKEIELVVDKNLDVSHSDLISWWQADKAYWHSSQTSNDENET